MEAYNFFNSPDNALQKQYEALRAYFYEGLSAKEVSQKFGYSENSLYCFASNFKKRLANKKAEERFFAPISVGRPAKKQEKKYDELIIALRKKYLSVQDIKAILDTQKKGISETYIYRLLNREGFGKLPRRSKSTKIATMSQAKIEAPVATLLKMDEEVFNTSNIGILCFLPYIARLGIDKIINKSLFPETTTIPKINSILSFLALKLSNIKRYTGDDLWCMDRGCGLFAGLNVLPKAAWFSSYSHRVTREMNISFLKDLHKLWQKQGLLSDTANLDFVAIPYWGKAGHLENNWSGTRHQALSSILAVIAQDPDTGLISYGDSTIRHDNESGIVVEFLDFYRASGKDDLKYLIFDSKFTTYENLSKLDDNAVKFITIRRRGKNITDELNSLPASAWKKMRVKTSNNRTRLLIVSEKIFYLKSYNKNIRQLAITGNGKIKPALIITNDFDLSAESIIRKYAQRWLVEKEISEQTHFFHLNKVSSSMVIKVDFDLTMTILAHNLYRLLAADLQGYEHNAANTLYEKFIYNNGYVEIKNGALSAYMKKKRNLPELLTAMQNFQNIKINWLQNFCFEIKAASNS
ncbi:MAG: transposase [Bacteroidota bacterium]|nr:transposase [Bacteroidota bacterium]